MSSSSAQFLQLQAAAAGRPLSVSTLEQLARRTATLAQTWQLHQALAQLLACAFDDKGDPEAESDVFRARLAKAAGDLDFSVLRERLERTRHASREAFEAALPPRDGLGRQ